MGLSPYVQGLRERLGHALLLLPGVTAVIVERDRVLLVRQQDTGLWSLVGGGIEPGENPRDAIAREVSEELGVRATIGEVVGAYGGPDLMTVLPNGDAVAYITVAYLVSLPDAGLELESAELAEARWFDRGTVRSLHRHEWVDAVLADATRASSSRRPVDSPAQERSARRE